MQALRALVHHPRVYPAADWPLEIPDLTHAGLYAWYVDRAGAAQLSAGLGYGVRGGLIYVGQTGATLWPSGMRRASTLASRIGVNHLSGRIARSTLRRTLAACLLEICRLERIGVNALTRDSERALSMWMRVHLSFSIYPTEDRDGLECLEGQVVAAADPLLNLDGCRDNPVRERLSRLRDALGSHSTCAQGSLARRSSRVQTQLSLRVTLHREMEDILRERGNVWMSSVEMARAVGSRHRYRRHDGTQLTITQVAARARRYPEIFACRRESRRLQIRLNRGPNS